MSKTPDTKLFDLIQSLSQTEKRYFKVTTGNSGNNNSHQFMEIFDCVSNMEAYNEEGLKKQLDEGNGSKHLAFRKSHLYDLILSSLRNYHKSKSAEFEALNLLQDIKITFDRGLLKQSERLLNKLKKKCFEYNFKQYLVAATSWEKKITASLVSTKFKNSSNYKTEKQLVNQLTQNQNELLSYLKKENELWKLRVQLIDVYRFDSASLMSSIKSFKAEFAAVLKSQPTTENHLELKVHKLTMSALINFFEGDINKGVQNQKKLVELLRNESKYTETNMSGYASEINNFLTFCFSAETLNDVPIWLDELDKLFNNPNVRTNLFLRARIYSFHQVNLLRYYNQKGTYKEFDNKQYLMFKPHINSYKNFQIQYNIAISYFFLNDFHSALIWINEINNSTTKVRPVDMSFIRILSYIIHFKFGNHFIIDRAHNSKDKTIRHEVDSNMPEKIMATYLTKISFNPNQGKELKEELINEYDNATPVKNTTHINLLKYLKKNLLK
jgi:hypothetical protein